MSGICFDWQLAGNIHKQPHTCHNQMLLWHHPFLIELGKNNFNKVGQKMKLFVLDHIFSWKNLFEEIDFRGPLIKQLPESAITLASFVCLSL